MEKRITLARDFWDCECELGYIHPTSDDECTKCGSKQEDQPLSRVDEVVDQLGIPIESIAVDA